MLVGETGDGAAPGFLQTQSCKRGFALWNNRNVELLAKSNPKHAEFYKEFNDKVAPTFLTPRAVDRAFGLTKATVDSANPGEGRDKKLDAFVQGLAKKPPQALSRMCFEAYSGIFDEDFETLAKTKNLSLAKYFHFEDPKGKAQYNATHEESPLQKAVREVHEAFQDLDDEAAISDRANDTETTETTNSAPKHFALVGNGIAERDERETLWKQLCEMRRRRVRFLAMPANKGLSKDPTQAHKQKLTKLWRGSEAAKVSNTDPEKDKPVGFILDAGVHCLSVLEGKADAARLSQPLHESGRWSLDWLGSLVVNNQVVMLFDGRHRQTRRRMEDFLDEHYPEPTKQVSGCPSGVAGGGGPYQWTNVLVQSRHAASGSLSRRLPQPRVSAAYPETPMSADGNRSLHSQVEGSIHYHVPANEKDARFPQRKVAFAEDIREMVYTGLPVSKVRL